MTLTLTPAHSHDTALQCMLEFLNHVSHGFELGGSMIAIECFFGGLMSQRIVAGAAEEVILLFL